MKISEAKKSLYKDLGDKYSEVIGAGISKEGIVIYLSSEPTPSKSELVNEYQGYNVNYKIVGEIKML